MRWKEHFLVPDHTIKDINGASFAGFYYICFQKSAATIEGFYYHRSSEWQYYLIYLYNTNKYSLKLYLLNTFIISSNISVLVIRMFIFVYLYFIKMIIGFLSFQVSIFKFKTRPRTQHTNLRVQVKSMTFTQLSFEIHILPVLAYRSHKNQLFKQFQSI